jgi:hypothetical protein
MNNTYLGKKVEGKTGNTNLVYEEETSSSGFFRIYIGDGLSALSVCETGQVEVQETRDTKTENVVKNIHAVINCAAKEEPYKWMNSREGIIYTNVVCDEIITNFTTDQAPDWSSSIALANFCRIIVSESLPTDVRDINMLIHSANGKNRSVVTAALIACIIGKGIDPRCENIETCVKLIKMYHPIAEPLDIYKQWAQSVLNNIK